jgi:hypothetical protein
MRMFSWLLHSLRRAIPVKTEHHSVANARARQPAASVLRTRVCALLSWGMSARVDPGSAWRDFPPVPMSAFCSWLLK